MQVAFVGLGRMGMNMVRRLLLGGHEVVAHTRSRDKVDAAQKEGARPCYDLDSLPSMLEHPRITWIMVPEGKPVDDVIEAITPNLESGDIIIDGGNSNWRDSVRRHDSLAESGIKFMDAGTSGGIWGLEVGYCMMLGGDKPVFEHCEPLFKTLAPPDGYLYCGPAGAGHFVKMVHNGIEYGMLQAYAEGFEILQASRYDVDLHAVSHLWNQGSVVRSWLCELAERMFAEDPHLENLRGYIEDSGEGRWTVAEAINENVPAPIITLSLLMRFRSRQQDSFSGKVIAGLRNQFGGHAVKTDDK
ncbi:MAG: decarboxylating 6-phosphogluconate dehydrogenase [Candidatus Brocadiia bacterium]